MAVLDKQDYMNKVKNLLEQPTYRLIPLDLTNKCKAKLINIPSKELKGNQVCMMPHTKECTQLGPVLPSSTVFQKYTKDTPLRPIFSSRNSVTHGLAKELACIL